MRELRKCTTTIRSVLWFNEPIFVCAVPSGWEFDRFRLNLCKLCVCVCANSKVKQSRIELIQMFTHWVWVRNSRWLRCSAGVDWERFPGASAQVTGAGWKSVLITICESNRWDGVSVKRFRKRFVNECREQVKHLASKCTFGKWTTMWYRSLAPINQSDIDFGRLLQKRRGAKGASNFARWKCCCGGITQHSTRIAIIHVIGDLEYRWFGHVCGLSRDFWTFWTFWAFL